MDQRTTLLTVVRRYGVVVAGVAVAVAVTIFIVSGLREPRYRTSAQILLGDRAEEGVFGDVTTVDRTRRLAVEQQRVTSAPVLTAAAERLGAGTTAEDIARMVDTTVDADADRIEVRAEVEDPERAAAVANAVVEEYRSAVGDDIAADARARLAELEPYVTRLQSKSNKLKARAAELNEGYQAQVDAMSLQPDQRVWTLKDLQNSTPEYGLVDRQLDSTQSALDEAQREVDQLEVDAGLVATERIESITHAEAADEPHSPAPLRDAAVAGMLALLCAGAVAWRRMDRASRHVPFDAVPDLLGVPALGVVPAHRRLRSGSPIAREHDPAMAAAEAFQLVAASLHGPLRAHDITTLLVTSPTRREGRTTAAVNLAAATALSGARVVLVDADLRNRGLSELCGAATMPGVSDAVFSDFDRGLLLDLHLTDRPSIQLLPAGAPTHDVAGTLSSTALHDVLRHLGDHADLIIVDGPPLLGKADATQLAGIVGGMIVVVGRPMTDLLIDKTRARLSFLDVPLLGAVNIHGVRREQRTQAHPQILATPRDEIRVDAPTTAVSSEGRPWLFPQRLAEPPEENSAPAISNG